RGDVREQIVRTLGWEHGQHRRGRAAGAAADLEHAQAPVRTESRAGGNDGGGDHIPAGPRRWRGRVVRLGGGRGTTGEQELERVDGAGERLCEGVATTLGERQLRTRLRMPRAQLLDGRT